MTLKWQYLPSLWRLSWRKSFETNQVHCLHSASLRCTPSLEVDGRLQAKNEISKQSYTQANPVYFYVRLYCIFVHREVSRNVRCDFSGPYTRLNLRCISYNITVHAPPHTFYKTGSLHPSILMQGYAEILSFPRRQEQ